ncbi:probable glycosyltransferase At5g20260 [Nymphaea colorata]|nr:probable glycosyltransferase At5g20260 [Nymphaea colorata]
MREDLSAILFLVLLAFSAAIFNSYNGSGTSSAVLSFRLTPVTMSAPAPIDSAPATMSAPAPAPAPTDSAAAPMPESAHEMANATLSTVSNASATAGSGSTQTRGSGVEMSRLEKLEEGLARSRAAIRRAALARNYTSYRKRRGFVPRGPIYHNSYAFHQSYVEMEKRLKIWIYREGEPPIFHDGSSMGLYSIEGHFIQEMDKQRLPFITNDPEQALLYFLPFSVERMVRFFYKKGSTVNVVKLISVVISDYVQVVANKYSYWNSSNGADHFMVACHDWAPYATVKQEVIKSLMRVICSANISEGFNPRKDVPLPEFNFRFRLPTVVRTLTPPSSKRTLAFFAGGNHGSVRKFLFEQWDGKDPQIQIFERLPRGQSYKEHMMNAKYCLCPSGYEVASPRLTESILAGCVPVPISDGYVLPFSDVLDWSQFSVSIPVQKIPKLKEILSNISEHSYLKLQANVMKVQKHFVINDPPKRFDVVHMLFHSIWLRRLNVSVTVVFANQIKDHDKINESNDPGEGSVHHLNTKAKIEVIPKVKKMDYWARSIAHQQALTSKPIDANDLATSILGVGGLPIHEYEAFQTALNTRLEGITLCNLLGMLRTHEALLQDIENMSPPSTNVTSKSDATIGTTTNTNDILKVLKQVRKTKVLLFCMWSHSITVLYNMSIMPKTLSWTPAMQVLSERPRQLQTLFHTRAIAQADTSGWYLDASPTHHVASEFSVSVQHIKG